MEEKEVVSVMRTYRDSLFRKIYQGKDALLSLYNAVNESSYEDPEALEINTLENVIYMGMKNDLSFIFECSMHLYEHQSTYNPNMPLRDLFYISRLLEKMIDKKSLYSSRAVMIPTPNFLVFYNGTEDRLEREELLLSSSFENKTDHPNLELKVIMLNVNKGKNRKLLEQCSSLREYAEYVDKVRRYAKVMSIEDAVEKAVDESIREGILADFLSKYRAEAIQLSIFEYDEEKEMRLMREAEYGYGFDDGKERGLEEGIETGKTEATIAMIRKKKQKGLEASDIADILELEESFISKVLDILDKDVELTDLEMAKKIL